MICTELCETSKDINRYRKTGYCLASLTCEIQKRKKKKKVKVRNRVEKWFLGLVGVGDENRERLVKGYKLPVVRGIGSEDIMCNYS